MAKLPPVARFVAPVVVAVAIRAVASRSVAAAHPARVDFQIGIELQVAAHRLLVKMHHRKLLTRWLTVLLFFFCLPPLFFDI